MAAITPAATAATTGFCPQRSVFAGEVATGTERTTGGTIQSHTGSVLEVYFFDDVDNNDTWTSGIPNIQAVAWQPSNGDDDWVAATVTTQATGVVTFGTDNAASTNAGWLWVLRGK